DQVKLIGAQAAGRKRKGSQRAELSRKEKVGAGAVDEIRKLASVAGYIGSEVARREKESTHVRRVRAVLSACCIDFKFQGWLELELSPSPGRGQWTHGCRGIAKRTIEYHAPPDAGAKPTDGPPGVELAAELNILSEGKVPIRGCHPAVYSAI